jgi:histidine triad (HIT) family protein
VAATFEMRLTKMNCAVCDKIKEKKALIAYEDDNLIAVLPTKPAVPGHVKIMPKQHFIALEEMSDGLVEELFFLANIASSAVFEALKAHGTNIILNESESHLAVDVIPRKENDGLNFMWKPKQLSPAEMDDVLSKVKDKTFLITGKEDKKEAEKKEKEQKEQEKKIWDPDIALPEGVSPAPDAPLPEKEEKVLKIPKEEKVNYMIKHLTKIP